MQQTVNKPIRYLLQAFNYTLFMALVWYFASSPSITLIGEDEAQLTVAFAHAGQLREPCRQLSQEELNKLAPNMRKLEDCPRERSPVTVEIEFDGELLLNKTLQPPGLFGDGGVDVFYSTRVAAGTHQLTLQMNDSVRIDGFNHRFAQTVRLAPAQILLVGFDHNKGFVVSGAN